MEYTSAQKQAMYHSDGNLLLSAAAGSGKTAALTGRIVQLVVEGRAEISQMLIVTFTKAAAGEMKSRIGKKLREEMEKYRREDQQIVSRISRAIAQLPSADISTIHSFLYKSLKPYFPKLNIAQDASILEPNEFKNIKEELMRDVVDDFFKKDEKESENELEQQKINFVLLADAIGQARDTTAVDAELLWLYDKLESVGKSCDILNECANDLETIRNDRVDPLETKFGKLILDDIGEFYLHYRRVFEEFEFEFVGEPKTAEKYGPALAEITEWLTALGTILNSDKKEYAAAKSLFEKYAPARLATLGKKDQTETSANFKNYRDSIKKEITNYKVYYFSADEAEFHKTAGKTAEILRIASAVLSEFQRRFTAKKHAMSILEYGDLETYATELLSDVDGKPSDAAREIGAKYKYIFVDEYQDTNRVQDNIFRLIAGDSVRFMVGDIKQSIYRFRGADPRVFSDYRRIWPKLEVDNYTDNNEYTGNTIFMSENFRCSKEIISFINAVSNSILPYGGIPYEADDALIFGQKEDKPKVPVEIVLIEKPRRKSNNDDAEDETDDSNADLEAKYVARRIKNMIGRYSEDGSKIIRPSDVAILLRSPNANGAEFRKELEALGIPTTSKTAKSLGEYRSILLLMCLMQFIDNPLRDIYAAGAMKSQIFGFSVDDIVRLRELAGDFPLYTAVLDIVENELCETDELREKCKKLTSFLEEEKTISMGISIEKYLESLIEKTNLYQTEEVLSSSSETDAIRKLLGAAKEFDGKNRSINGNKTLRGFIEYIEEIIDKPIESDEKQKGDCVSIMSIHASKGLEFPICFVCKTAKKRNTDDESRTILYDDEYGFGMQLPDSTGLVKYDNLIRRSISRKIASDSKEEEMRMLYVALTRARTKLIVTAKTTDAEKLLENAKLQSEFADGYSVRKMDSYIDWILSGVIKNQHSEDWKIYSVRAEDIEKSEEITESNEEMELDLSKISSRADEIRRRFDFKYPYNFLEKIPSKLVVSRLQPEILDEDGTAEEKIVQYKIEDEDRQPIENRISRPKFMIGKQSAAANEIGSATHKFLQFVDFAKLRSDGFEGEKARLTEKKYISKNDAEIINIHQIRSFMQSSLFDALGRSDFVKREFRFNVLVDAEEFTEDSELKQKLRKNEVKITVQGVVDCVYRDADSGKLVLIDYKTDSITADEWKNQKKAEDRLREKHRNQLTYYKKICSQMFEEEIEEVYIYSTVLGRCIAI